MEKCKLCQIEKELRISHALPNAWFKRVFNKNGHGHALTDDDVFQKTSDSMATPLLCDDCEKLLNENYEKFCINLLRGSPSKCIKKESNGIRFSDISNDKFCKFVLSIYWRAALSPHPAYNNAVLHEDLHRLNAPQKIREGLYRNSDISEDIATVKLRRIYDSRGERDLITLKSLMIPPYWTRYKRSNKVCVNFVAEGFLFSIVTPGLSRQIQLRSASQPPARKRSQLLVG